MKLKSSIVIATYNGEDYIYDQLNSILDQTQKPDEVLIFDDGSIDSTVDIIEEFICTNSLNSWKIRRNKNNKGYILNFLEGILECTGEIIFLCDQDDLWMNNKIECINQMFIENSSISAIHTDTTIINENGKTLFKNTQKYKKNLYRVDEGVFKKKMNYPGMALILNAEFAKKSASRILESNKKIPTHDWTLCAMATIENGFYCSNKVLTKRRFHKKNVALNINSKTTGNLDERSMLLKKYLDYYQLYNYFSGIDNLDDEFYLLTLYRLKMFDNVNINNVFNVIKYMNNYPSIRAIFADLLYLLKLKRLIKVFK